MGRHPGQPDDADANLVIGSADSGESMLRVSYPRLRDVVGNSSGSTAVDYVVDGIRYALQISDGLSGWIDLTTGEVTQVGDPSDRGDGTELVTVEIDLAKAGLPGAEECFVRLVVAEQP